MRGDQVVTSGGLYGKVMKVDEREVLLQIDKNKDVRVRFTKSAILDVVPAGISDESGVDETEDALKR